ncbi:MAG: M20/M25/M40 family metallo-hydrolase [Gemmatimonadales bacterium]
MSYGIQIGSRIIRLALVATMGLSGTVASLDAQQADAGAVGQEAFRLLREYVRINTINPPGNEMRGVEFFAKLLEKEGIPYESAESAPGRGNIWARLKGGDKPALVLLHHMDVVPADPEHWTADPLSGEVRDGFLYGRGTLDTKTLGIEQFMTFVTLHRRGVKLNRDVIFMATADEEAGGFYGAGWMVENRRSAFEGVGLLLNEGGGGTLEDGKPRFEVEVTQKVPLWLELEAVGQPSHGSTPHVQSAVNRLVRALYRLQTYEFAPHIVPAVDAYFRAMAPEADEFWRPRFQNMAETVKDRDALLRLQTENPFFAAITRNTCSITILEGSSKINVVPPDASAQLDCRLLPDQDPAAFVSELRDVLNDQSIEIRKIMGFTPAVSTTDTDLYRAIEEVVEKNYPGAPVIPTVQSGFTDSHFTRDLGIVSYGFSPDLLPLGDEARVHGNDERILVEQIKRGTRIMLELVSAVVR